MKAKVLLMVILLIMLTACGQPSYDMGNQQLNTVPESEYGRLEDLEYLCATLEKRHKNLYHKISKEEFLNEKEKIAENISSLSDNDFFYEMQRLVALIGDGHTGINFIPSAHDYLRPLPFAITKISDYWYVEMTDKAHEKYLGCQIIAINDVPIETIFDRAEEIISYDNETMLENRFPATISFIDALKYLNVTDDLTAVHVTLKDISTNSEETVELPSYNGRDIFNAEIVTLQTKSAPTSNTGEMYRSMELDQNTYFIQYNTCTENDDLPMPVFAEQVRTELINHSYSKVIIDLRYNSGGNSAILKPMIDMLSKQQKVLHFDVYVLIGHATNSSAMLNSIELKEATNCLFVGTPTGGNVNHYGELETFALPNFPATVHYSTKYFKLIPSYDKNSLYPDILIASTYEDFLEGIDKEVQTILNISD